MPLSRRAFVSGMLATPLAAAYTSFASTVAPMKITRIETVYWNTRDDAAFWPSWTWIRIDTDAGIFGLGETYWRNSAEAALIHNLAPSLPRVSISSRMIFSGSRLKSYL
jgi:galactonate dehydratase